MSTGQLIQEGRRWGRTSALDDVIAAVFDKLRGGPGAIVIVEARVVVHTVLP